MLENEFEIFYTESWRENIIICFWNQKRIILKIDKYTFVSENLNEKDPKNLITNLISKIEEYTTKRDWNFSYGGGKNNNTICSFWNQMLVSKKREVHIFVKKETKGFKMTIFARSRPKYYLPSSHIAVDHQLVYSRTIADQLYSHWIPKNWTPCGVQRNH